MSTEKVSAERIVCDNCGRQFVTEAHEERPLGFYFPSVFRVHGGGGDGVTDIYACTDKCIKGAVIKSLNRDGRG